MSRVIFCLLIPSRLVNDYNCILLFHRKHAVLSHSLASNGPKHPLQQTAALHSCGNYQRLGRRFVPGVSPPPTAALGLQKSHLTSALFNTAFSTLRCEAPMKKKKKFRASFNGSLILATWFIHVATADITTLINHAVRHAGRPRAPPGLTNLGAIFHLNNLALPQGRPTPDTDHWREAFLRLLFLSAGPTKACRRRLSRALRSESRPTLHRGQ